MYLLLRGLHLCWLMLISVSEDLPDGGCGNESSIFLKLHNTMCFAVQLCCSV